MLSQKARFSFECQGGALNEPVSIRPLTTPLKGKREGSGSAVLIPPETSQGRQEGTFGCFISNRLK